MFAASIKILPISSWNWSFVSPFFSLDGKKFINFTYFFKEPAFVFFIFLFWISLIFLKILFSYLFLTVLGLRFCARAFSSCGERGPLFIAVHGSLTMAASLVAEHRLQTRRLSNCGSRAQLLRIMWDPPRPGLEPVSPALAGRLWTTAPPGKPKFHWFLLLFLLLPSSAYFEFICSSLSSFLRWKLWLLNCDLSSFLIESFNTITFTSKHDLAAFCNFWYVVLLFSFS